MTTPNASVAHRLPARTHLGRVRLEVADLTRSLHYYETVLGLRLRDRTETDARLTAQSSDEVLVELVERRGARPVTRNGRLGLYHFAILLPDRASLGRFLAHLQASGVYMGMSDHLVSEALYLRDPDGLGIEVYADRPRDTWVYAGDELAMASNQLDAADLIEAGKGAPWTGMPAGTTIGHMHLHVADLEQARAFYDRGLGFDVTATRYPGALFFSAGGYHHHLGTNTWAAGAERATDGDARLAEWELHLPDESSVAAAAASLENGGYAVTREASDVLVDDPWGARLRIKSSHPVPQDE